MTRFWLALALLWLTAAGSAAARAPWETTVHGRTAFVYYNGGTVVRIESEGEVWTWTYRWDGARLSGGSLSGPPGGDTEFAMAVFRRWEQEAPRTGGSTGHQGGGEGIAGFLLVLSGLLGALSPRTSWYLAHGWRFRNAEPSDLALFFYRAGGVVSMLVGVVLILA